MEKLPKEGDLLGRFEIKSRLGQGGMGIVYLARDPLLNIEVALKVLKPQFVKSGNFERIQREVLLARKVSHPGICRLYDIHKEDETLFITMEYVAGPTLRSLIDSKGIVAIDQSVGLICDICDAIAAAHKLEVIHRDLKPGNIVVRGRTQISILDFGLAKAMNMSSITATDIHVGTFYYMSPEVLKGKQASVQSDIYSLGVILYECVTGRPPYVGEGVYEIGQAISQGKPVPPAQFNPQVSAELEEIISRAIAPDPKQRYRTIGDLKKALDVVRQETSESKAAKTQVTVVTADQTRTDDAPPEPAIRQADISTPGPWHGDIDKSVAAAFRESEYSEMYRQSMRESTILFSDIVGITPYFDKHGDVAGLKKIKLHNDLLSPEIERYRGEVIKTIGDAYMVSFDKADDGVGAAIAMQRALARHNRKVEEDDQKILIRIGLNSGKSIFDSQDVFGDVVNVAARVSALAQGDQVIVSSATYELLGPTKHLAAFHSETTLKGKRAASTLYTIEWELQREAATMIVRNGLASLSAVVPESAGVEQDQEDDVPQLPDDSFSEMPPGEDKPTSPGLEGSVAPLRRSSRSTIKLGLAAGAAGVMIIIGFVVFSTGNEKSKSGQDAGLAMIDPTLRPPKEARTEIVDAGSQQSASLDAGIVEVADQSESSVADAGRIEPADSGRKPPSSDRVAKISKLRALRKKFKKIQGLVYSTMHKKGIISGDSWKLDKEFYQMKKLAKRRKYSKAIAAGNKTLRTISSIKINKAFIESKFTRFNRLYDKTGSSASENEVEDLVDQILNAQEKRNFTKANKLFNKAFKALRKGRR
ncbi:MAG: protein kinase [Deltaproteobacteria bacterium]|nr:protein kinase [Deltaproteobacteria bacterium]